MLPCNYPISHVIPWDRESLAQHEDTEDITWGHHAKTGYYSVVMLSKAATTHCSSEPWVTCFVPTQALLANIEILRHKCPYLDHQKEGSLRCWNTFFTLMKGKGCGQKTAISQGLRYVLCHFWFMLLRQKACTVHLGHQASPSGSISPCCSDNNQGKTRQKGKQDLPIHEVPAMHWNHGGYRNWAEGKSGPILFCLFWETKCNRAAVPL